MSSDNYSIGHKSIPPNFLLEIRVIIKIESTKSEHFFTKIQEVVSGMNSCIGQGSSSTYKVVSLSNKRSF